MKNKVIIACSKDWFLKSRNVKKFINDNNILIIKDKKKLKFNYIKKINPKIIFFPHWSHKVDNKIINNFKSICFHTSPLPFGRGGSPIQNLIIQNFKRAPVCAIQMTQILDGGPIYLKKTVSLSGNLDEIFYRVSKIIIEMIKILIRKKIKPKKQIGKPFIFKRIDKKASEIKKEKEIREIYNKIRMLNAPDYPNAFIKLNKLRFVLTNPILKNNTILYNAKIIKVKN